MTKEKTFLLWVLILLGVAAGLASFRHRYGVEARNRRVELVIDYSDAQLLANTTPGRAMDDTLTRLRQAGITTVAVTEDTLQTLLGNEVIRPPRRDGDTTLLTFAPGFPGQEQRVMQNLEMKTYLAVTPAGPNTLRVNAPWPQFNGTPIGLDADAVAAVQRNGLLVAPRLLNFTGVNAKNIAWELAQTKAQCASPLGIGPLIFAGAAVLGDRPLIRDTATDLVTDGLTYGTVEFAKTFGDGDLSHLAAARTVRVHSIGEDEMGAMEEQTAVDRFILAARERNIRVCYVRLFTSGLKNDGDVVGANTRYIGKIVAGLRQAGLTVGGPRPAAHPYGQDPTPSRGLRVLMGLGVAAGVVWLLRVFLGLSGRALWVALAAGALVGVGLAWPQTSMKAREALALLAACTFPTLGLCAYALPAADSGRNPLVRAFLAYARMTAATLAGIVLVVGLLSGRLFLLKVDEFFGVKLVLIAPILLVAAYYWLGLDRLAPDSGWSAHRARAGAAVRRVWSQPLLIGQTVVGLLALAVLVILALRSGNDPGVGVSPLELKFRAVLGQFLGVRPRTKEFGLGHPALFFALASVASGRFPRAVVPLLIVGAIGQASLMDTFCHLHTPLAISLMRAFLGWALGLLIGVIAFVLVARFAPPGGGGDPSPAQAPPPPRNGEGTEVRTGASAFASSPSPFRGGGGACAAEGFLPARAGEGPPAPPAWGAGGSHG